MSSENLSQGLPLLIVDSWPVAEWVFEHEPTASRFRVLLNAAERGDLVLNMSRINFGEVVYSMERRLAGEELVLRTQELRQLPLHLISVDDALVDEAAQLKGRYSFAYADAFAAALAIRSNAPVLTGDKEFLPLQDDGLLQLRWLGA